MPAAGMWVVVGGVEKRRGRADRPMSTLPTSARFVGDPGTGKVLIGATVYTGSAGVSDGLAWLNTHTGVNHLLSRRYFNDLWSRSVVAADRAAGRIPFPSFKLSATTSNIGSIISGTRDADLAAEAQWAAAQGYMILCSFYHEPEDNWVSDADAANYRAAFRRIVSVFLANGATNVLWMPILMTPYSFQSSGGGEAVRGPWFKWDADWKGTRSGSNGRPTAADWYTGSAAVLKVHGFDQYIPHIGATVYREFSFDLDQTLSRMIADGRTVLPWVVPEMGTKGPVTGLPADGWTGYYQRAFQYMRDNNGLGFITYNTDGNNLVNATDSAIRLAGYQAALTSEAAYLVSVRP